MAGVFIATTLIMGIILYLIRQFSLPFGSLMIIFTINGTFVSFTASNPTMIIAAFLTGLGADLLYYQLIPSVINPGTLDLFSFSVPVMLFLFYYLIIILTATIS